VGKQGSFSVIVAGPELAKAMPKTFKAGASYVVASANVLGNGTSHATTKRAAKSSKPTGKVKVKKAAIATKPAKPAKTPKAGGRKGSATPDTIVKFVKANPGTNMTAIEAHAKLPQADIRKALNTARELGLIRTEGQRRGLRYFAGGTTSPAADVVAPTTPTATPAQ
jgi:hypothetical protein